MAVPRSHVRAASLTETGPRPSPKRQKTSSSTSSSSSASSDSSPAAGTGDDDLERLVPDDDGDASFGIDDFTSSLPEIPEVPKEEPVVKKFVRGTYTRSIYVDAFNLALDTVLKEESYLFSEDETEVFARYRSLEYEAQHLYVCSTHTHTHTHTSKKLMTKPIAGC